MDAILVRPLGRQVPNLALAGQRPQIYVTGCAPAGLFGLCPTIWALEAVFGAFWRIATVTRCNHHFDTVLTPFAPILSHLRLIWTYFDLFGPYFDLL